MTAKRPDRTDERDVIDRDLRTIGSRHITTAAAEHPISFWANVGVRALAMILSIPAGFLPNRTRERLRLTRLPLAFGTSIGGIFQLVGALWLGGYLYRRYMESLWSSLEYLVMDSTATVTQFTIMGYGGTHFLGFMLFTPTGWLLMYFFAEGLIRAGAGLATGQPLASLPLWLLERVLRLFVHGARSWSDGPPIADRVEYDDGGTVFIDTCRERNWNERSTLKIDETLYTVVDYQPAPQATEKRHRHRYTLQPIGPSHLVRSIYHYHPEDILDR